MGNRPTDATERLLVFQREVNRLFRRFLEEGSRERSPLEGEQPDIRVDVYDREERLVVEIETPGVPRDALTLTVSRDLIVLEGEKPSENRGRVHYHCVERDFGSFRQVVEIPVPINTGAVEAVYAAGVLTIIAPRIIEDRRGARRKVEITDGDPGGGEDA